MVTIFRKLRKEWLFSLAFRKYIYYAIGEIILVVFGILIALQINNWNQNRLDRMAEQEVLIAVRDKMKLNRFQHGMGDKRFGDVIASAERLLFRIHSPHKENTDAQIYSDLNTITKRFIMGKSNKTNIYDELIASDQMRLLTSDQLRKTLTDLKVQMELLEGYEELQIRFVDTEFSPFLNRNVDRFGVYSIVGSKDTSGIDNLSNLNLPKVATKKPNMLYNQHLFQDREFSNLLFELVRQTTVLQPIYGRIDNSIRIIDSILVAEIR